MTLRWLLGICFFAFIGWSSAQSLHVGVILSRTGAAASIGRAQATAIDILDRQMGYSASPGGIRLEVTVVDDGSIPSAAVAQAQRLIEASGVDSLLCCSTEAATKAVAALAERENIPMLALSSARWGVGEAAPYWVFGVPPSDLTLIRRMVLDIADRGESSVALMALDNSYGQMARDALEALLGPGGPTLVAEERYPPGVRVLTPEALWVATRQPGGVVVWGLEYDSALAYEALRNRGYEGPVYLDPHLLYPVGDVPDLARLEGALLPMSPAAVGGVAPREDSGETNRYLAYTARFRLGRSAIYGAYAWDALLLLRSALALTSTYGLDLSDSSTLRQALRDSLVGMGPVAGAAATYDYQEERYDGVLSRSLVVAKIVRGEPTPLR